MTRQYLAGELSLRLAELQAAVASHPVAMEVACLRRAETGPLTTLASIALRALEVTDRVCWDSLTRGDAPGFERQAMACAALWEFADCAGLLEDP